MASTSVQRLEAAGFTEEEIKSYQQRTKTQLMGAGFSEEEAGSYVGKPPLNDSPIKAWAKESIDAALDELVGEDVDGVRPDFTDMVSKGLDVGFGGSVTGLLKRNKLPEALPEDAPFFQGIASQVGALAGDFPFMVAGAVAGSGLGPPGQVGGAFAVPAGMRASLIEGYKNGSIDSFGEFWERTAAVFLETAKGALTGAATGKVAAVADDLALPAINKLAAEVTTMVTVGKTLEGEIPSMKDFTEAAIVIGGVKVAMKTAGGTVKLTSKGKTIANNLMDEYKITGLNTKQILEKIKNEPLYREQLLQGKKLTKDEVTILGRVSKSQKETKPGTVSELYRNYVDATHPLNQLTRALHDGARIKDIPITENPYKLQRLAVAAVSKANLFLELEMRNFQGRAVGKGLKQILDPVKNRLESFRAYAVSRRAIELEGRGVKTGMDIEAARANVAAGKGFEKQFNELVKYSDNLTNYLKDSGIISVETFNKLKAGNKDYIPFFRLLENQPKFGTGIRDPIKTIKGSEKPIIDPLESVIKNTYLFVELAERNSITNALAKLSETSPKGQELVKPVKTQMRPTKVQSAEMKTISKELQDNYGITFTPDELMIFRPNHLPLAKNQIAAYIDGKRKIFEVDEMVADVIKGADKTSTNMLLKMMSVPSKTLRAGAILNPEFFVRNLMRDNVSAMVFSTSGFKPFVSAISGALSLARKDKMYRDWLFGGGAQATLVALDRQYLQTNLRKLTDTTSLWEASVNVAKAPLEILRIGTELAENATRLGEFKNAMKTKAGKAAIQDAAFKSREITLDFAKMGASIRGYNMIAAFTNARIQGYDRLVRAFLDNPAAATGKAVAAITLPSVLLWLRNHDDDRYKNLPQWQKDMFWIVLTDDTVYRIPKPFELGILFGTFPEHLLDKWADSDTNLSRRMLNSIGSDSISSFIPNALIPVIEQAADKSLFRNSPLIPKRLEGVLPADRYTEYSTELSKAIGNIIGGTFEFSSFASPIVIENYVRQWSGGLGMYALKLADKALREAGALPDPVKPEDTLADIPFIKGFVVRYPSAGTQPVQDFYEHYQKASLVMGSLKKRMQDGDIEGVERLLQKNPAMLATRLEGVKKALSAQTVFIRAIYNNPQMTPSEKRAHIDNAYYQMINTAMMGNDIIKTIEKAIDK